MHEREFFSPISAIAEQCAYGNYFPVKPIQYEQELRKEKEKIGAQEDGRKKGENEEIGLCKHDTKSNRTRKVL